MGLLGKKKKSSKKKDLLAENASDPTASGVIDVDHTETKDQPTIEASNEHFDVPLNVDVEEIEIADAPPSHKAPQPPMSSEQPPEQTADDPETELVADPVEEPDLLETVDGDAFDESIFQKDSTEELVDEPEDEDEEELVELLAAGVQTQPQPTPKPPRPRAMVDSSMQTLPIPKPKEQCSADEFMAMKRTQLKAAADIKSLEAALADSDAAQRKMELRLKKAKEEFARDIQLRADAYARALTALGGPAADLPVPHAAAPDPVRIIEDGMKALSAIAAAPPTAATDVLRTVEADITQLGEEVTHADVSLHKAVNGTAALRAALPVLMRKLQTNQAQAASQLESLESNAQVLAAELTERMEAIEGVIDWYQGVKAMWSARYKSDGQPAIAVQVGAELSRLQRDLGDEIEDHVLPEVEGLNLQALGDGQRLVDSLGSMMEILASMPGLDGRPELVKALSEVHAATTTFSTVLPDTLEQSVAAIRKLGSFVADRCEAGAVELAALPALPPMAADQLNSVSLAGIQGVLDGMRGARRSLTQSLEEASRCLMATPLLSTGPESLEFSVAGLDESIKLVRRHISSLRATVTAAANMEHRQLAEALRPMVGAFQQSVATAAATTRRAKEIKEMVAADKEARVREIQAVIPLQPMPGESIEAVNVRLKRRGDELVEALRELRKAFGDIKKDRDRLALNSSKLERQVARGRSVTRRTNY
ncbi:hypothetical protein J8273_6593 [Carpediemonas membranifera]|uniref:Uncharacterized protein n=1 Tax=Carpediemonas membranifera TaxID=201153 RepID=A0A8J6E0C1_9EUKA|nr:hypothetical protein J8273_6593 [Carpediemonas membranifera]|eukprot:KAG9392003.1 hypothetical protein J8273_6593 [Carpediemonas membranifera]